MSTNSEEELEIISLWDEIIEDGHAANVMVEDQSDLKQPTNRFSSYNGTMEPWLRLLVWNLMN